MLAKGDVTGESVRDGLMMMFVTWRGLGNHTEQEIDNPSEAFFFHDRGNRRVRGAS